MPRHPSLFSIPPGTPFLTTFVQALLNGDLIEGFHPKCGDPLALSTVQIYVPTRRAARALRSTFVALSPSSASFLPTIRPLADVDEDQDFFSLSGELALSMNAPIGMIERLLLLARLVKPWREGLPADIQQMFGSQDVAIPANTADAIWLSADLAALMDNVETEDADWAKLKTIAPDDVAAWWQITLHFLEIVSQSWPTILQERGLMNPAAWRNQALRRQAQMLQKHPPQGPVIAAGSTGSIPPVAELLKTVADLPKGAVVLPGLDCDLDDESWDRLVDGGHDLSVFGHPQYGLRKLLDQIGGHRSMVTILGQRSAVKKTREKMVSQALRPADTTEKWIDIKRDGVSEAVADIALIEATAEREEALAIAVALRHTIEQPSKTAALVTNDRNLARRVSAELGRFGIVANDSGGNPLSETLPMTLIRLILSCVFSHDDPVALLSLLKHPLSRIHEARSSFRAQAEKFEFFMLRGGTGRIHIVDCLQFVNARLEQQRASPFSLQGLTPEIAQKMQRFAGKLQQAVEPLAALLARDVLSVHDAAEATVRCFETFGCDEQGSLKALYDGEAGSALISFFQSLIADRSGLSFKPSEWPVVFDALLAHVSVRPKPGGHPRLFIWGGLEARLQTVDTIVIGGLNEGSWPATTHNDPFMSRPMKAMIALEPPELKIGLAAHDFQMALGMDKVILSRAVRVENAPAVPSRWLQRLETVLGTEQAAGMRARGAVFTKWARALDQAPSQPFVAQPNPSPALERRPRRFSVTEIETLRRDPYAIYAKKILQLKALERLVQEPSAAERGTLYHEILAQFIATAGGDFAPHGDCGDFALHDCGGAFEKLMVIARQKFDAMKLPIDVEAIWWPRFSILAKNYITWEKGLGARPRFAEIKAEAVEIGQTGVFLSGRADRIDIVGPRVGDIIDFKTGATPSPQQAATLLAPQLALEGALMVRGAFHDCGPLEPNDLFYVRLQSRGNVVAQSIAMTAKKSAQELAQQAWTRLEELILYYQNPQQGYLSRALPAVVDYAGDYDHLARVSEWLAGYDNEGEL